jgi:hypothetical protein
MNKKEKDPVVKVNDLRDQLKVIMKKEIENLPTLLEGLDAKDRVTFALKLATFVFPKPESVHYTAGEGTLDW